MQASCTCVARWGALVRQCTSGGVRTTLGPVLTPLEAQGANCGRVEQSVVVKQLVVVEPSVLVGRLSAPGAGCGQTDPSVDFVGRSSACRRHHLHRGELLILP